jgi:exopolysaccharide biosynthesis protein
MLLRNGQFTADAESFKADVTERRHPRTIVGTDGSRMIWAVVDGRSALHSRGGTMEETRWIARSLGMTNALNMDGGGSSQIVWRGVLANSPSDGKERPLPYAVVMLPKGAPMTRRSIRDRGEFGLWGYTAQDEMEAVYMDVYDPLNDAGAAE